MYIKSKYLWLHIKNNHLIPCDFSGIETAEGQAEAVPEKGANNTQAAKKTEFETSYPLGNL